MQTVRQLLDSKPNRALVYVNPESTVFQALQVMAENDIGAVLVMEEGGIVGIFSERDYARRIVLQGRTSAGTKVRDIMTSRVVYVTPSQTLDDCMGLMTEKRIRHLPVLEGSDVMGMLSIGDLVRATIEEQEQVINHLVHYIQSA
ncbi:MULTISPECIES: CBS domain-containing protein [Chromobacterium]|uniref:CBS domain-containing protein n=3 Tax=Chromobacterium TaxID=535 RepID=A0A1W0CB06_9NEIS|nr:MULTISPECIES: CBS domain-containing protein [Chromobacterium]AXT45214.1 CBS domain-containing protein [Chromobacterium rhizoryzae]MBK0416584.1 CBS domain-containing protein [Chromobacterium haemolyticum]MBO0417805.1 CBS domain-containing protein [Chromobacterium haemolyticum]MBO0500997.1 CBS domain-containing protein [Chromobacterium haemolyticum]MDH0343828.1 CBS domain-containing protein [Chromobacterium haemolyticum]